ncbi:MAG TPA: DUF1428 domain-containing protein [Stellaceae bacterium]|nr:DUF1428 domain-containing protein [Stellaceae bacterium]
MAYIDGFVAAVPQENKRAYLDHVREALILFKDHGATRMVENWGDDVPIGKVTDFHRSVQKRDGEAVLFSWVEWPSKNARDAGMKALEGDERTKTLVMPFDGKRMIFGGFSVVVEEGSADVTGYVDGITVPVPLANRAAYVDMASVGARLFREYGALRVVNGWGDDVPDGKITDFRRAVAAREAETVVFNWIEWPSKQVRDEAWLKLRTDPRMQPDKDKMPFDGQRAIYGGFTTIFDA